MTIAELLKNVPYEKIKEKFLLHYGDEKLRDVKSLYNWLTIMEPSDNAERRLYICIDAFSPDGRKLDRFDENNPDIDFDVSAYEQHNKKEVYSISATSHSDFINCFIDEDTLTKYSPENILAHCFLEITSYAYSDGKNQQNQHK